MVLSSNQLQAEVDAAELAVEAVGDRERRLWDSLLVFPEQWAQLQYPNAGSFWVVAIMGRKCLYHNHIEGGWGWGRFDIWGLVSEYHWQQDEIQHVICQTLLAIDHGESN